MSKVIRIHGRPSPVLIQWFYQSLQGVFTLSCNFLSGLKWGIWPPSFLAQHVTALWRVGWATAAQCSMLFSKWQMAQVAQTTAQHLHEFAFHFKLQMLIFFNIHVLLSLLRTMMVSVMSIIIWIVRMFSSHWFKMQNIFLMRPNTRKWLRWKGGC